MHAGYPAESIGALALQRVRNSRRWSVLCVYRHCFYCQDQKGDIICIGTDRIGHGPISICGTSLAALLEFGISAGDVLYSESGRLDFENKCFFIDVDMARIWDARLCPAHETRPYLERHIGLLKEVARRDAPGESLGQLIPAILSDSLRNAAVNSAESQLSQLLSERFVSVMKACLQAETCNPRKDTAENLAGCLTALIGTGFGLTPSGDDFCCGVILGTALMGDSRKARDLARLLKREAVGKTTLISNAYYTSLAESYISESQAELLARFGNSDDLSLAAIVRDCAHHGSTSGWDMLAGFAFAVELARIQRESGRIDGERACIWCSADFPITDHESVHCKEDLAAVKTEVPGRLENPVHEDA